VIWLNLLIVLHHRDTILQVLLIIIKRKTNYIPQIHLSLNILRSSLYYIVRLK